MLYFLFIWRMREKEDVYWGGHFDQYADENSDDSYVVPHI